MLVSPRSEITYSISTSTIIPTELRICNILSSCSEMGNLCKFLKLFNYDYFYVMPIRKIYTQVKALDTRLPILQSKADYALQCAKNGKAPGED